ncbi:anti-sigma factor family protein [Streptomyces sp. 4N509B]|uniref:anti-sigma factor family protein n=1 Tax=Streptomyces sp. 4N509B TaxID=3457413 RepID=UPI003FD5452D
MTSTAETGPADQHLGESLAALIDGELSHDRRDRVLAHLATCPSCKDEADAHRRLKSVFAASPLPTPSATLMARLQGLPATGGDPGSDAMPPPGPPSSSSSSSREEALDPFPPISPPGGRGRSSFFAQPLLDARRGFRIHEPGAATRSQRGHRLAFAAAGAVSLAAFALGGAVTSPSTATTTAAAGAGGGTVAAGSGAPSTTSPVSTVRTVGARLESTEEASQETRGAQTTQDATWPVGQGTRLFPVLGPILAPDPGFSGSTTSLPAPMFSTHAPVGGLGIVGGVDPR